MSSHFYVFILDEAPIRDVVVPAPVTFAGFVGAVQAKFEFPAAKLKGIRFRHVNQEPKPSNASTLFYSDASVEIEDSASLPAPPAETMVYIVGKLAEGPAAGGAAGGAAGSAAAGGLLGPQEQMPAAAVPAFPMGPGGVALVPVMAPGAIEQARAALFAILDRPGHPVGCGFFVSSTGIALTINHDYNKWTYASREHPGRRLVNACKVDGSGREVTMTFRVISTDPQLDFTVLRLVSRSPPEVPLPPTVFYPLPPQRLADGELWGQPAGVIHGNIALNRQFDQHPSVSVTLCNISTVHADRLLYSAATSAGDSGGAVLLHGQHLIGLHVEGVNDVVTSPRGSRHYKTPSEAGTPSTSACALRLDIDAIRQAVAAAETAQDA